MPVLISTKQISSFDLNLHFKDLESMIYNSVQLQRYFTYFIFFFLGGEV